MTTLGVVLWSQCVEETRGEKPMTSYEWLASNSAPKCCPMEIITGDFIFQGGGSLYIPPKVLKSGWGTEVSVHVVGPDTKPLPDRMQITFYSYLEDKLYHGEFPLPYGRIEKLFADGFANHEFTGPSRITYNAIVAGVAPGGAVAVWVSGIGRQTEVFFGRAQEIESDWHETFGLPTSLDRKEYRDLTLNDAIQKDPLVAQSLAKVPLELWETYRKRYPWRPVFEGMATPKVIGRNNYVNGEPDFLELPLSIADQEVTRPVPTVIRFVQRISARLGHVYELTFDEVETRDGFERLARAGKPIELVFSNHALGFSVLLRNEDEALTLSKLKTEIYRTEREMPE